MSKRKNCKLRREIKQERLLEELEAEEHRQKANLVKAMAYHQKKVSEKYFANWRTFTR